jgi:hypothetical protein
MGEPHFKSVIRKQLGKPICPLNGDSHVIRKVIGQSNRFGFFRSLQSVQVDMNDRKPPLVFMDEQERRTRDRSCWDSEASHDPADQCCLTSSQFTDQGKYFTSTKHLANGVSKRFCLARR